MKKPLVIDYESYYDNEISASTQGVPNYVRDSYSYIVSFVSDDLQWCGTTAEAQAKFGGTDLSQTYQLWGANSNFDQRWHDKEFPTWKPEPWKCVLDLGATQQLPQSLTGMGKVLFGRGVDKTLRDEMKGKHWADLSPVKQTEMIQYCLNDSVEEFKVIKALPEPAPIEQEIAAHTRLCNRRGVAIDTELIENNKTLVEEHRHRCFLKIPWHNEAKPLSAPALAKYCNSIGVPCPKSTAKDDEECDNLMDVHPRLADVIAAMRGFRKDNTKIRKIESILTRVTDEGSLPLELIYCGARHTRRWSSRGVNVQNLDKAPLVLDFSAEDVANALGRSADKAKKDAERDYLRSLAKKILEGAEEKLPEATLKLYKYNEVPDSLKYVYPRHWLMPRPGKIFLILDFSQIEPRCLNWLVGNEVMLDAMRKGFGIYEAYARASMKWKGGKLKDEDPRMYQLAKACVLGAGYGAGADTFKDVAWTMCGLELTDAESKAAILGFRKDNPKITGFWKSFDGLIRQSLLDKDKKIEIQMPTGDYLRHFHIRPFTRKIKDPKSANGSKIIKGVESYTTHGDFGHQSHQPNLWGGVLTENVTQRMARDLLAEGVLRCEKAGLTTIFTSHDEAIFEVDDDASKDDAYKSAEEILTACPAWAEGLPLAVEGGFEKRYTK